jgi:predicted house-cleaning NTP pyrophosphatase (Maf/HAM1 superfamily)
MCGRTTEYAKETALHKAIEVAQRRFAHGQLADLVIAADTVVDLGGEVLEKPDGAEGAERMLSRLSGSRHKVHTGVALILPRATGAPVGSASSPACQRKLVFWRGTQIPPWASRH